MLTRRGFAGFASCALCGLAEFAATEVSAQGKRSLLTQSGHQACAVIR
jgi:hypothetical protein